MTRPIVALLFALGLLGDASAQAPVQPLTKAPLDPYTGNDPVALKKAGYVSLGPFTFGTGHSTEAVESLLGDEPLAWIETAHFMIGCSLSKTVLKGDEPWRGEWSARLKTELKRLAQRLPNVKPNVKELDPWLRAHLIAQRAEDVYAEVQAVLGVTDASFPPVPGDDPTDAAKFRGLGPYLGMPDKFRILLVRRSAGVARYTRAYHEKEMADPIRRHDTIGGFIYWGASEETGNGLFANDLALHAHLVFNLAHNMYVGYRSYGHEMPGWLPTGLAHWHSRRITPRYPTHDRRDDDDKDPRSGFWEWDERVRGLTKNKVFEPLDVFMERDNPGEFGVEQHIQAWAVTTFLLSEYKDRFPLFMQAMKEPFHGRRRQPSLAEMRIRQRDAVAEVFETNLSGLNEQWRQFVLKVRPRK